MHLAVDEHAGVEVVLCVVAEEFVLGHDALVHLVDELEVGFGGVAVAVDLITHGGGGGGVGQEALDHEEVGAV